MTYSLANPVALPRAKAIDFEISLIYHDAPLPLQLLR